MKPRRFLALTGSLLLLTAVAGLWRSDAGARALAFADREVHEHQRLTYALHLAAGRLLALCPCTRAQADTQYLKATAHAATDRQLALATTERPRTVESGLYDATAIAWLSLHNLLSDPAVLPFAGLASSGAGALIMALWLRAEARRQGVGPLDYATPDGRRRRQARSPTSAAAR